MVENSDRGTGIPLKNTTIFAGQTIKSSSFGQLNE